MAQAGLKTKPSAEPPRPYTNDQVDMGTRYIFERDSSAPCDYLKDTKAVGRKAASARGITSA